MTNHHASFPVGDIKELVDLPTGSMAMRHADYHFLVGYRHLFSVQLFQGWGRDVRSQKSKVNLFNSTAILYVCTNLLNQS